VLVADPAVKAMSPAPLGDPHRLTKVFPSLPIGTCEIPAGVVTCVATVPDWLTRSAESVPASVVEVALESVVVVVSTTCFVKPVSVRAECPHSPLAAPPSTSLMPVSKLSPEASEGVAASIAP
jgi:hypothetical protein